MVSIITKRIRGNEYLYLVKSVRSGKKVVQKTVAYICPKRPIPQEEFESMELSASGTDWILTTYEDQLSAQVHAELKKVSEHHRSYLARLDPISRSKERERFLSRFIAESNAIEGSTLSRKETFDFLFSDITPKGHPKKELFMAQNLLDAWEYMEPRIKQLPMHADLKELHRRVNHGIETDETLGAYKRVQNYIGDVHTTSYVFVEDRMKRLLQWIKSSLRKIDHFEVAFQSHAQFEVIHPFVDGNGRVGRLLLNWILMHRKLMPLAMRVSKRSDYILALDNSRHGRLDAICNFCAEEYNDQYKMI